MSPTPNAPRRLTRTTLLEGVAAVTGSDDALASVVDRYGPPPLWGRRPGFAALVRIILEQQVSLASARATYDRMENALGEITPERLASVSEANVRRAGVTRQKASYSIGLARQVQEGTIDLRRLGQLADDDVREALMAVRGIGK